MLLLNMMQMRRMFSRRLRLFLVVLLLSQGGFARAQAANCPPQVVAPSQEKIQTLFREAKDRGFLWKLEKQGRSGYLYGSIHLGKQEWMIPGPKTMAALAASDVIALELDILDPSIQSQLSDPARFGFKHFTLPPPLQKRMEAVARSVCAPMAALATLHPVMQWVSLSLLDARFSDLEISYGNEVFLAGFARGANKPVESLESAELQMRALMAGEPRDIIEAIDRSMSLFETGKNRVITERMARAWASGNLSDLQDYQRWCECATTDAERKSMQRLNDDRNPALAEAIDKLMGRGKPIFAAVGALHMIGQKAVPRLLQEMGYKIERVAFDP